MDINNKEKILVIGHKNPDTDSLASAVGYAFYKTAIGIENVEAGCTRLPNSRTQFLFEKFNTPLPQVHTNVFPRIQDVMNTKPNTVKTGHTLMDAMAIIQSNHQYRVPVVNSRGYFRGIVSLFDLSNRLLLTDSNTENIENGLLGRTVKTTIDQIATTLGAKKLAIHDENHLETLQVYVAAMSLTGFREHITTQKPKNLAIVVADREDIQYMSCELRVRLLIVTGNSTIGEGIIKKAQKKGTTILQTPLDSATTIRRLKFSSPVEFMKDNIDVNRFKPNNKISDIKNKAMSLPYDLFTVLDNKGKLAGTFTKNDLNKIPCTKLVLVDHNEIDQAVDGASEVPIIEILDHHRLDMEPTITPITVHNDIVGSTSTLVSELLKEANIDVPSNIAGILMGGVISDTLLLKSPTSTPRDFEIIKWLEKKSGIKAHELYKEMYSVGSLIATQPAIEVLTQDKKSYSGSGFNFAIAQVEEVAFEVFKEKIDSLLKELKKILDEEKLDMLALLVTNIMTEDSLLLVDGKKQVLEALPYKRLDDNLFELPDILSRKKQLLPQILQALETI